MHNSFYILEGLSVGREEGDVFAYGDMPKGVMR